VSRLHAGAASADLPAPEGVQLAGYGVDDRPTTDVHDPLEAAALALSADGRTVAVVSADLLNVSREVTARVERGLAERDAGVDDLLLAATHTHAAPYVPADAIEIHPTLRMEADEATLDGIVEATVDAVATACERCGPASVRVGRAENDETAVNRRAVGGVSGTIRVPRGEIDPELVVLDVETPDGEAVVYNYACHPVCNTGQTTQASADWPGVVRRELRERVGDDATILFLDGAAGDVNPRGRDSSPSSGPAVYDYVEEIGTDIAETVFAALEAAREAPSWTTASLSAEHRDLRLPLKDVPDEAILERRLDELGEDAGADRSYVEELLHVARWPGSHLPATLSYVEVGDVGLLGMPAEVFAAHGLAFKEAAPVGTLLPVGYAGGYVGYLPPLRELENGDYEVRTAKVAPEGTLRFRKAAMELLARR